MKTLFTLILISCFFIQSIAQVKSCCSPSQEFAALGNQESFKTVHKLPGDYKLEDAKGKMIKLKIKDGDPASAYFIKSDPSSNKYIFVFHEWWGLNDYVKRESDKLSNTFPDANIIALDLYDGNVAVTREDASKFMQSVNNERAYAIIDAAKDKAGDEAKIATIGWCFGGSWSLQAAIALGESASACVIYYGMPELDPDKLSGMNAPVLGIFAKQDGWITPKVVNEFSDAMEDSGNEAEIYSYDAHHAFANPSNDRHNEEAAEEAWKHVKEFIKRNL